MATPTNVDVNVTSASSSSLRDEHNEDLTIDTADSRRSLNGLTACIIGKELPQAVEERMRTEYSWMKNEARSEMLEQFSVRIEETVIQQSEYDWCWIFSTQPRI